MKYCLCSDCGVTSSLYLYTQLPTYTILHIRVCISGEIKWNWPGATVENWKCHFRLFSAFFMFVVAFHVNRNRMPRIGLEVSRLQLEVIAPARHNVPHHAICNFDSNRCGAFVPNGNFFEFPLISREKMWQMRQRRVVAPIFVMLVLPSCFAKSFKNVTLFCTY